MREANRPAETRVETFVIVARRVAGVVLVLTGAVWIGQGTDLVHGSSMRGSAFWAAVGAVCVVAGLAMLAWPWRQSRPDA
jgi:hypothetical protein